ncbi:MAG TPA: glycosyltransferase family 2 protein [Polyangiaceae bacterium]|nr:glycosyltransferase family 2 protein [Polyangiaceae bacterium]
MAVATLSTIPPPDHAPADLDVSIVMPCLNEERTLPACIEMAHAALDTLRDRHGLHGEVVVADNGSQDSSRSIAEQLGARVVPCPVRGYGAALRYGILGARGRFIVMGDADGSYDFREAVPMVERLMEGFELCMGSRFRGTIQPGAMPWMNRYVGNPVLSGILNLLFHSGLSDAHCGMRAFTKSAFERLNPSSRGMEFASEMLIKATLLEQRRTEVPITLHPDGRGRPPHLRPFRDGWRHLRYLMMLSPVGLFLFPGALSLAVGITVFVLLLSVPPARVFVLGGLWIGDHWLPLAMALVSTGHLSLVFAMAATLVGIQNGYRRPTRLLRWLYWASKLEHMLFTAGAFAAGGAIMLIDVAASWAARDFGQLGMQRQVSVAASAFILAAQTFFGGFLLSIVAGNEADLDVALEEARRAMKRRLRTKGAER